MGSVLRNRTMGARMGRAAFIFALILGLVLGITSREARPADAALIEAASREGKVLWYTTLIVNQAIRPLKAAFEKAYPGIELQFARADESPTATKIMAEAGAG